MNKYYLIKDSDNNTIHSPAAKSRAEAIKLAIASGVKRSDIKSCVVAFSYKYYIKSLTALAMFDCDVNSAISYLAKTEDVHNSHFQDAFSEALRDTKQ